jgi:hypothetical protein
VRTKACGEPRQPFLGHGARALQQAPPAEAQAEPHLNRVQIQQRALQRGFEQVAFVFGEILGVDHGIETPIKTHCCGVRDRQARSRLHFLASG